MIKRLIIAILLLFVLNIVSAGQIFPIDFEADSEQTLELAEKEAVEFINYEKGVIVVQDIMEDDARIKIILSNGKSWGEVSLERASSYAVDIQRDNKPDFVVINYGGKENKIVFGFKSLEFFSGLDVEESTIIEKEDKGQEVITGKAVEQQKSQLSIGAITAIIIIVLGLLAFFFLAKKKR